MVGHSRAGQIALKDDAARGAQDPLQPQRHAKKAGKRNVSQSRENLELSKLLAERDKIALEASQLQGAALRSDELRAKKEDEAAKRLFELRKLRHEAKNARWSPYFEFGKVFVSALAIAASIYGAGLSIAAQQNKDRAAEISQQLLKFNENILDKKDANKQRQAISAVRSLGAHAIPSLITNLDLGYSELILAALRTAILRLNEDQGLRPAISQEILSAVHYVAIRRLADDQEIDIDNLERYVQLWRDCLRYYETIQPLEFESASLQGRLLANELSKEIRLTVKNDKKADEYVKKVSQLHVRN
jgi:hypothetical protein